MIKANELRIGNYVLNPDCIIHQVSYIKDNGFINSYYKNEDGNFLGSAAFVNAYKPIRLTPEILGKCGFENRTEECGGLVCASLQIFDGNTCIEYYNNEFILHDGISSEFSIDLEHIKHLHQLQNLFYALRGEELGVNIT